MTALKALTRCREIGEADLESVAGLLVRGFPHRSRDYWLVGLNRQATRTVPQGYPRYGYLLEHEGNAVGVLLLIYTDRRGRKYSKGPQPARLGDLSDTELPLYGP